MISTFTETTDLMLKTTYLTFETTKTTQFQKQFRENHRSEVKQEKCEARD